MILSRTSLFILLTAAAAAIAPFPGGMAPPRTNSGFFPISKPHTPAVPEPEPGPFSDDLPAKGKFLVASRGLTDPRFQETVVLLIDYSDKGATGLIINRPTNIPLAELLPSVPGIEKRSDVAFYGGPVEGHRMLMLIRSVERPEESGHVFGNVYVSASRDALERMISSHKSDKELRMYAGYAGWMPRQLDWEISRGDWLITSADEGSIFDKKPSEVWRDLFGRGSAIQVWNRHGGLPQPVIPE